MCELELKYPHLKDLERDADGPMFQFLSDPDDINRKICQIILIMRGKQYQTNLLSAQQ